jgi:hypothetical protein
VTEAEWLASTNPQAMVEFLHGKRMVQFRHGKASDRKLRLLAAACCRRIWPLLTHGRSRAAVEVAERYADGLAGVKELDAAWRAAQAVACEAGEEGELSPGAFAARAAFHAADFEGEARQGWNAWGLAASAAGAAAYAAAVGPVPWPDTVYDPGPTDDLAGRAAEAAEAAAQSDLVRDAYGNPFRPASAARSWGAWRGGAVLRMAQAAYDDRLMPSGGIAPGRLAVLADALEEAGCTVKEILDHLRGPGPHVRGCWAVDLLLEKE